MFPPIERTLSRDVLETAAPNGQWLDRFSTVASRFPERTAVICGKRSISYAEIESDSNWIARNLVAMGMGAGDHVGAGFHRSDGLISALIGILKSGAAYVPLDPGYPEVRIARMIAAAGLKTVVTSAELADRFSNVGTLCLREDVPSETPALPVTRGEGHAVYAIFTSGSTGEPKAASVNDSGFANLLAWYGSEFALGPDDRTLVISSPSFDLTQKNLFAPLLTGGTLILDDCQTYDIPRILGLIWHHGATLINCTPSAFYPLVDAAAKDQFGALATLRFAVLGGEPISIPRIRPWLEHPSCRAEVVNSYGPTECTDICLFHRIHRGNVGVFPFVPLGSEIPNVRVTIRDEALAMLPDGETGELCITGAGVGGGYLNDPELSARRFIDGIYRSGDLARRLPDGTFEFRGRADHQVKVNGFRIELGEIEIAINEHAHVREAVLTSHGHRLIAHVHGTASVADLRDHLSKRLPAYMMPAEFRFVENFPLTPNGKIDRKALSQTVPAASPVHCDSSLESRILALWSEVLGQSITDANANFFDVGGNSIHLAVVHVRLREMTNREFPITDLFALPNARAIARHFTSKRETVAANPSHDRARLAKAGFSKFQRPLRR